MDKRLLKAAKEVVDSLNKNLVSVAPLDEEKTKQLEEQFVSLLPLLENDLGLKNVTLQPLPGQSGSKTEGCFADQQLVYVVKRGNARELARELVSRQLLENLHLKESHLTDLVLVGKTSTETVFIQAAAKGKALPELLQEPVLKKALLQMAKGLAELHLKDQHLAKPLLKEVRDYNFTLFYLIIQRIEEEIKQTDRIGISLEELDSLFKKMNIALMNQWGNSSYSHGDCALEHLFFDEKSGRFTWIDTPSFVVSVDTNNHPIGFAPYDFSWTWCSLINEAFRHGLSTEDVCELETHFRTEYERLMGNSLSPKPARDLADVTKLLYFVRKANHELKSGPNSRLQNLIDYSISYIAKRLEC